MVFNPSFWDLMIVLIAIAAAATLQFYKGRRVNLALLEFTIKVFERVLKPRDKNYNVIGIYVGYRGIYKLGSDGVSRVEVVVTLMPRQSLLYYPVALLTSRFDKVYVFFRLSRPVYREAHVIRKHYYRAGFRRAIKGVKKLNVESVDVGGKTYYLVYNDATMAHKLLRAVKGLSRPSVVNHLAVVPSTNSVYLAARVAPDVFEELISRMYRLATDVAGAA